MEILLWFIVPLLILTHVLFSWVVRIDARPAPLIYKLAQVARVRQYTVGFWGLHGLVVRFENMINSGSTTGNAKLTTGHWSL